MANLTSIEKSKLENLLGMASGYVLNFSNATLRQFVKSSIGVDIQGRKYGGESQSKAKRMRLLWELETDKQVGKLIEDLISAITDEHTGIAPGEPADKKLIISCLGTAYRLQGKDELKPAIAESEEDFLSANLDLVPLDQLGLDPKLIEVIESRMQELRKCLKADAPLSVIFHCGSILEGLLLCVAQKRPKEFNQSPASPKDRTGKTKPFPSWTLDEFINVANNIGILGLDVKKHGHSLRDFRNYIHPFEQMKSGFCPDSHTAKIGWQVLNAAINDIHTDTLNNK